MQFKKGTSVYTAGGDEVGHIDRVVLDPQTNEVVGVVVRKGFLFIEDKVVLSENIARSTEDRVELRADITDLDSMPTYEDVHYIPLNEANPKADTIKPNMADVNYAAPVYWYPPLGLSAPYPGSGLAAAAMPYVTKTEKNIPEGTVALKEGARVISSDDQHVGDLDRIFTENRQDTATHFLISQGLFFKARKLVPINWVKSVEDNEVHLTVPAELLDRLPDYHDETVVRP
ncbi:MAG: PRC-barrel domain-containing protein [Anaerolineae bacterium]|nr:PRC-barrel domain-containing protein [Anaerolineae bacterium]